MELSRSFLLRLQRKTEKLKRVLDKYMYDLGSCTFCQLCVITCPHDALEFVPDFEHAVFTREKLVKQLNHTTEATVENK